MSDNTVILVVDDNPPMAQTMADILSMTGYKIHVAYSGVEALGIVKSCEIHIMLTDVVMPDMDGVTLYRVAKKIQPDMITFLMTAYAADDIIQQGISEGIKTVLTKPVDINLLLSLVQAVEETYIYK